MLNFTRASTQNCEALSLSLSLSIFCFLFFKANSNSTEHTLITRNLSAWPHLTTSYVFILQDFHDWNIEITTIIPYDCGKLNLIFRYHKSAIHTAYTIARKYILLTRSEWIPFRTSERASRQANDFNSQVHTYHHENRINLHWFLFWTKFKNFKLILIENLITKNRKEYFILGILAG